MDFRDAFQAFLETTPHKHVTDDLMALIDIVWDERAELDLKDRENLIKIRRIILLCSRCSMLFYSFQIRSLQSDEISEEELEPA